jgi:hypothetical protein
MWDARPVQKTWDLVELSVRVLLHPLSPPFPRWLSLRRPWVRVQVWEEHLPGDCFLL